MPDSAPCLLKPYYLGCPVWACREWVGNLYSTANRRRWLTEYSQVFSAIEVNSTFYGMASVDVMQRWADETVDGFQFALKFPRTISHDAMLVGAEHNTEAFLGLLILLRDAKRLGPAFLQLPRNFSARHLPRLADYLGKLPRDLPLAVELRHADFYDDGPGEREAEALLTELRIDRAQFDTRALWSVPAPDDDERHAQRKKVRLPGRATTTASRPFVRFIGRNDMASLQPWIDEWAATVANWITAGLTPYIFTHAPSDPKSLEFAVTFHAAMRKRMPSLPPLADFPGRQAPRQQSLFD